MDKRAPFSGKEPDLEAGVGLLLWRSERRMAKRAALRSKTSPIIDLNPDVSASGRWNVHRAGEPTLGVNADRLDITDSGALIFIVGSTDDAPPVVIASNAYSYCVKVA